MTRNKLRQIMLRRSMTIAELARLTGLSLVSLRRIRDSKASPGVKNAIAIARAIGVSVEEIFG